MKWSGTHQGLVELASIPATPENVLEEPALRILPTIDSDPARFLASVVWKTNGIGSTAQLQLFEWKDGQPQEVWTNQESIQQVSYRMSQYEAESAWMEVPSYHYKERVPVSKRIYDSLAEGTVEERAVTAYGIQDYDRDGRLELAMVKAIRTGAVPLLPFGLVLEFYSLDSDPPSKRMTIPLPPAVVPYVETGLATGDFSDLTTGPTIVQEWAKQYLVTQKGKDVYWNLSSK
ncbi:hypothetical protein [Gorillibacterium sp. CAU 1737]|uniref:hypothetical protein n=1 Tax=Gorillibacterium sp. CAU 1737 TaxID=3140362 RepID=UPI0032605DE2